MMLEQYLGPARPREIDMTCTTKDYMVLPKYNETMRHLQLWGVQGSLRQTKSELPSVDICIITLQQQKN